MTLRAQADPNGNIIISDTSGAFHADQQPSHEEQHQARPDITGTQDARAGKATVTTGSDGHPVVHQSGSMQARDVLPNRGVMDSVTRNGMPIPAHLAKDTDVVNIPALGGTLRIREAIQLGYLRVTEGGQIAEVTPPDAQREPSAENGSHQEQPEEHEAPQKLDEGGEAFFAEASAKLGPMALRGVVHQYLTTADADAIMPTLAKGFGVDLDEASARFTGTVSQLQKQGMAAAQSVGLDPESLPTFEAWCKQHKPGERLEALSDLVEFGKVSKIKALTRDFLASQGNTYDESEILAADFGPNVKVFRAMDGRLVVALPDGTMRFSQAVAEGRIRVTRNR